jgi:hypothetical protein
MRPIRSIVTVVMVGLASTLGVASAAAVPVAAHAAVQASLSSAVGSSHAKAPNDDIYCPNHMGHWVAWYGTCVTYVNHACNAGIVGNMNPPNYVSNDCGNNIYLYTQPDQGGTHLCVAGQSRTHHLATKYHSWKVIVGGC